MPSPRWLVVTVLEGWSGGSQTLHPRGGQEILDRCRISQIGTAGELANGTGVEPETTYIRFERTGVGLDREFERGRIEVRFDGAEDALARLYTLAQALGNDLRRFQALVGR